ncbi:MAG: tetratricopeptide repeat protein [Deltaproteobacteria bacterium]|nr:tetratricopeptide repeat protein [Deltaproteobacteria bacterium]
MDTFQKEFSLLRTGKEIGMQAWNLEGIGLNLIRLGRYEEAIEAHKKALDLWIQEKNTSKQAWNQGLNGLNLYKLGRHEEALEAHQRALDLWTQEKDISGQAREQGLIGLNLNKLERHEEALEAHRKAVELRIKDRDISGQAWDLGQMAAIKLLKEDEDGAWKIIDENSEPMGEMRYEMVKQIGDAICSCDRKNETARAFALAGRIFHRLSQRGDAYDPPRILQELFTDLLSEKLGLSLLKDIFDAAVEQFGESIRPDLEGIAGIIEYLISGKDRNTLLKMDPEKRRAVEAIIERIDMP